MTRVAIVGLGRIGCGEGIAETQTIRSHVGAIQAIKGISLSAIIDADVTAQKRCIQFWSLDDDIQIAESLDDLSTDKIDVISLCTPSDVRVESVRSALKKRPKVLIIEKPLANTVKEAMEIISLTKAAGVELRVNFHRRFDAGHIQFRNVMSGFPQQIIVRYSKGLFNYASHAVDLVLNWFGAVEGVQSFSYMETESDPHVSFVCHMKAGFDAYFIAMPGLHYDQFEADFFFSERRMELANGGTEKRIYEAVENLRYPGYTQLAPVVEMDKPKQVGGLRALYQAVHDYLVLKKKLPGCSGDEALMGLRILEAAQKSSQTGGAVIAL